MKPELIVDAPIIDQKRIWVKKIEKPHFDHPLHFHHVCELVWIEKSHGKLLLGDFVGNFFEGDIIFCNPGMPHLFRCDADFYNGDLALCTKAISVYFPHSFIPKLTDEAECLSCYKIMMDKAQRGLRFFGQAKKEITELVQKISSTNGLAQLSLFLQMLQIIVETKESEFLASVGYKNCHDENDLERFNKVYQFLLENFNRKITVNEIASISCMTPNSFCRYFKSKTQKTFTRFVNELRIGHARKLLQNQNVAISDICYNCGYDSPVNFFKFFKLITHKTPKQYRTFCKL